MNNLFTDMDMRQVVHGDVFSIDKMTDKELRESIIADILVFTMHEKQSNTTINFNMAEFLRFIKGGRFARVAKQLEHEEIKYLIEMKDGQIRIRDQKDILQAAMDYCGFWYDGFSVPNSEDIIGASNKVKDELLAKYGSVENMAKALAIDLMDPFSKASAEVH